MKYYRPYKQILPQSLVKLKSLSSVAALSAVCAVGLVRELVLVIFDAVLIEIILQRKLYRFLCENRAVKLMCRQSV